MWEQTRPHVRSRMHVHNLYFCEKFVGTTELHYNTRRWEHSLSILKSFFRPTLVRV